jgi:hypothetical protein
LTRVVKQCDEHPSRITCHFGRLRFFFLPYSPKCVERLYENSG